MSKRVMNLSNISDETEHVQLTWQLIQVSILICIFSVDKSIQRAIPIYLIFAFRCQ